MNRKCLIEKLEGRLHSVNIRKTRLNHIVVYDSKDPNCRLLMNQEIAKIEESDRELGLTDTTILCRPKKFTLDELLGEGENMEIYDAKHAKNQTD